MRRKYDSEGRIGDKESRRSRSRKGIVRHQSLDGRHYLHRDTSSDSHCLKQESVQMMFTDVSTFCFVDIVT